MAIRNPNLSDPYEYMAAEGRNISYQPSLTVQPRPSAPLPQPGIISGSTIGPLASAYDSGPITSMTGPNIGGNSIVPILRPPETPLTPDLSRPEPVMAKKVLSNLDGMNMDPNLAAYIMGSNNGAMPIKANPTRADLANIYATTATPQPINPAQPNPATPITSPFDSINSTLGGLTTNYNDLSSAFSDMKNNVQDQFGTLNTGFSGLQDQFGGLSNQFGTFNTGLTDLQNQFGTFNTQFGDLQSQLGNFQTQFGDQLNQGIGSLNDQFQGLQGELQGTLQGIDNRLSTVEDQIQQQPTTTAPQAPQAPQFSSPYYSPATSYGMGYSGYGMYNPLPSIGYNTSPYSGYLAMMGIQSLSPNWVSGLGLF